MQIHELNNFTGTPTSSDYLAIDNSTTTTKIGATGLGVQDQLTVAEAETGTSTASRIVTPKVVHDYVVQDTTHLASGTILSWATLTGNDGSIDDIATYLSKFCKTETGTLSYGVTYFTDSASCVKKQGNFVWLSLNGSAASTWSGSHVLATLPEGFRPVNSTVGILYAGSSLSLINILDTGYVQTPSGQGSVSNGANIRLNACFSTV